MEYTFAKTDISLDLAMRAHYATSHVPEKRGESVVNSYYATMQRVAEQFSVAEIPVEEFDRFKAGLIDRYNAWLHAKSRCMSSMITGPANFPVRRAEKANRSEGKRLEELFDYETRIFKKILNRYSPEHSNIIKSGDSDAVEQLQSKIAAEGKQREHMKATNAAFRAYKKSGNPDALMGLKYSTEQIQQLDRDIEQAHSWEKQPFPTWQLQNLGANIRRLKDRLEGLEKTKAHGDTEKVISEDFKAVANTEIMRLQLFFPKERADIRVLVKAKGFRWAPSLTCWQRQLTNNARADLRQLEEEIKAL